MRSVAEDSNRESKNGGSACILTKNEVTETPFLEVAWGGWGGGGCAPRRVPPKPLSGVQQARQLEPVSKVSCETDHILAPMARLPPPQLASQVPTSPFLQRSAQGWAIPAGGWQHGLIQKNLACLANTIAFIATCLCTSKA